MRRNIRLVLLIILAYFSTFIKYYGMLKMAHLFIPLPTCQTFFILYLDYTFCTVRNLLVLLKSVSSHYSSHAAPRRQGTRKQHARTDTR